ncbi:glycosyltransferase family 2 protein [Avibacterium avium]|uniref:glycosyltransferase family 2 protein n=1 Tax=Avibacterium avium TaxID=751 RepID=UPI003BF8DC4E
MNSGSICAVIVTYNRKLLLVECLKALLNQSQSLNAIYIINNASTDGTEDYLEQQGWLDNELIHLFSLSENLGGAGGFSFGVEKAYQNGFDYIWLMDDDGCPAHDCLEILLSHMDKNCYLGPLVLDKDNPNDLCFPMRIPNTLNLINNISDLKNLPDPNIINGIVIPFNGILFSCNLVKKIGIPKKEYFIWGDDFEYTKRAEINRFKIATITKARFYHPKESSLGTPMLLGKLKFNDTPSNLKLYCMCRNSIVNHSIYNTKLHILAFIFKVVWFYLFTKPNSKKLFISLRAIYHGLKKDFRHHKEYLK